MKVNVFSIFLLSFCISCLLFADNEVSEVATAATIQPPLVELNLATKGALIEAVFILQNMKNRFDRHLRRVKIALLEVDHLIKDLVYERQILFDHFYRNKVQQSNANMIDRILVDLSVFYGEILNINLIKAIYPRYLKQVQYFVDDIGRTIEQFVSGTDCIASHDLQMKIDKFDNILDIIGKEEKYLKLMIEIENIKLNCKKYKDRINSRNGQLKLYQDSIKDKEDPCFIEHKGLIDSSIKYLKKSMSKLINELEDKKDKIKSIKQGLKKHYIEHEKYSQASLFNFRDSLPLNASQVRVSTPTIDPSFNWFIEKIEEISKKLNKNFNIEDLA